MLHACGVADPEGAVIALVAKSGTGKTTASSQLARTFGYITDETVAIRADGTLCRIPSPCQLSRRCPVPPNSRWARTSWACRSRRTIPASRPLRCSTGMPTATTSCQSLSRSPGGRSVGAHSGHVLPGVRYPAASIALPADRQRGRSFPRQLFRGRRPEGQLGAFISTGSVEFGKTTRMVARPPGIGGGASNGPCRRRGSRAGPRRLGCKDISRGRRRDRRGSAGPDGNRTHQGSAASGPSSGRLPSVPSRW